MPMPMPLNLRIAAENRTIAKDGCYYLTNRTKVMLPADGKALAERTKLLDIELPQAHQPRTEQYRHTEHIEPLDTISCILKLRADGVRGEILALNFANANVAGGGYILGGNAQEESLCRASLLYHAIAPHKEYYTYHRLHPTPLYSDKMLYSPDVPVFRNVKGKLLGAPQICSFLTVAAVNRTLAKPLVSEQKITDAMQRRTAKIIAAAADLKPEVLVLGAFGCGAFGNRREVVLPQFDDAVNRYLPSDVRVIFAIP